MPAGTDDSGGAAGDRDAEFRRCATIRGWRRSAAAACALSKSRGRPRPVTACTTLLADGMEISTHTEQLEQLRRTQLRLLARQYPAPARDSPPSNEFLTLDSRLWAGR